MLLADPAKPVVDFEVSLPLASYPYSILPTETPAPVVTSSAVSRLSGS
ncbi:hypothetical protein ACFFIA_04575 [Phytohabitans kaempferiae]|uniref:Uncharacterized protein n=1 Tax=Phytohabitans kaempferiae TaxID=1620943 RepID=A0ABV6LWY9_9ACTN